MCPDCWWNQDSSLIPLLDFKSPLQNPNQCRWLKIFSKPTKNTHKFLKISQKKTPNSKQSHLVMTAKLCNHLLIWQFKRANAVVGCNDGCEAQKKNYSMISLHTEAFSRHSDEIEYVYNVCDPIVCSTVFFCKMSLHCCLIYFKISGMRLDAGSKVEFGSF